jgi:NAD(P)-dependent dehydrogenase (short-subunit alcohol dehydrogenase family)
MGQSATIIGGTGQIGRAVAHALLDHGWEVTLCHRGNRAVPDDLVQRGVKIATVDRDVPGAC